METQLIGECRKSSHPLSVVSETVPAIMHIHEHRRRLPLTEKDLLSKLVECLRERFGHEVPTNGIAEFAQTVTRRIWSERRVKLDQKVFLMFPK